MRSQPDFSGQTLQWAAPGPAGWRADFPIQLERQRRSNSERRNRVLVRPQPQTSLRRIRAIGFAASSAATAIWFAAIAWWQIGA